MQLNIDARETIGGIILAFASQNGGGYHCPMIIAGTGQRREVPEPPPVPGPTPIHEREQALYTVSSLEDGFSMFHGTRAEVLEWISTKPNLHIVPKMLFSRGIGQLPENRPGMPMVVVAYSGADGARA